MSRRKLRERKDKGGREKRQKEMENPEAVNEDTGKDH